MHMKKLMLAVLMAFSALMAFSTGCVVSSDGEVVAVAPGHVCVGDCDHYYHGGRYYYVRGHHHGPGCGHVLRGGVWVVASAY
jgi:hypothetical protein